MEIRQLKHFVAVADTLSFRRAAERVNLTPQAVSKSIIQLEAQIGLKLLDRDRQSVMLTGFGDLLLPHARTLLAEVQSIDDGIANMVGRKFGQLRIGATPTLLDDIVPTSLRLFLEQHPNIRVMVDRGDFAGLRDLLLQGELDVVLSTAPDEPQSHLVVVEEIATDQNIIVVGADHEFADGQLVSCERLKTYPRLATHNYRKGENYVSALFSAAGQAPPQPTLKAGSTTFAVAWVQQSHHWWIVPRRQVSQALRKGELVPVSVAVADSSWPLVLATRRHATRSPAVLAYADIVRAVARES